MLYTHILKGSVGIPTILGLLQWEWTNPNENLERWVNIGSGNGLLPDGTKLLPVPIILLKNINHIKGWVVRIIHGIYSWLTLEDLVSQVQDCSISIANALAILQLCTKPSTSRVSYNNLWYVILNLCSDTDFWQNLLLFLFLCWPHYLLLLKNRL